jgi:hypothetical protein
MSLISTLTESISNMENSRFTVTEHLSLFKLKFSLLSPAQRAVFDDVISAVENNIPIPKCFFIDGIGGAGKTFIFETLTHCLRSRGEVVIPVAWTGMAASLLDGGKTVHSTFSLPVPLVSNVAPKITADSAKGRHLISSKLIIWDECTQAPSYAYNSVDILLKDLMKNELPFGGKTLLMAGDFRQTLAIYKHGSVTDILSITVKKSNIWPYVKKFSLTENLRANTNASQFKNWTIDLGDGKLASKFQTDTEDVIALPNECVLENNSMVDVDHIHLRII